MNDQPAPWRFVTLTSYESPPWPATENVRRGLRAFWRSFRHSRNGTAPAVDVAKLRRLPAAQLDGVFCHHSVGELTAALDVSLQPWGSGASPDVPVRVVVSAAHCGTRDALVTWAEEHNWTVIKPPSTEEILNGGQEWLDALRKLDDADCVLPRLEKCFLRHAEGLDLCRRLVSWLLARKGRCLVGCNSWAWAYLSAALGVNAVFPAPMTLAALNDSDLQRWFQRLLAASPKPNTVIRNASSGGLILTAQNPEPTTKKGGKADEPDDFFVHLAAGCRGNAAVAWAIWRHSLQTADPADTTDQAREKTADTGSCIWIKPWTELNLPAPTPQARQSHRFIFHALLIHGGLNDATMALMVPISGAVLSQSLHFLQSEGLIEQSNGVWQVAPCAYPAVRQALINEEYLAGAL